MAQTFVVKNLDPDDVGQAARQLAIVQILAQRIALEALSEPALYQTGPLQNVNVQYGTQSVVACQANVNFNPSSHADVQVYQQ